MAHYKHSV